MNNTTRARDHRRALVRQRERLNQQTRIDLARTYTEMYGRPLPPHKGVRSLIRETFDVLPR